MDNIEHEGTAVDRAHWHQGIAHGARRACEAKLIDQLLKIRSTDPPEPLRPERWQDMEAQRGLVASDHRWLVRLPRSARNVPVPGTPQPALGCLPERDSHTGLERPILNRQLRAHSPRLCIGQSAKPRRLLRSVSDWIVDLPAV